MKSKHTQGQRAPLPWHSPVITEKDSKAVAMIKTILAHPSYRIAEEDPDFMQSYEGRGTRLSIDYLKAELTMARLGVEYTIVVFGSTRIVERKTAIYRLKVIQKEVEKNPQTKALLQQLHTAERMVENSFYYDDARRFGSYVGKSGKSSDDCRVTLMTGGGPGIMEAANRGAYDVGARSVGLNIGLPHEQFPNPYITPELCFQFHYFAIRKLHFLNRAKALVVYPGGFGTFDELFEMMTLIQTGKTEPIPVVLVGKSYWNKAINFDFLSEEGLVAQKDREIYTIVDNADDAWGYILNWYQSRGESLFPLFE